MSYGNHENILPDGYYDHGVWNGDQVIIEHEGKEYSLVAKQSTTFELRVRVQVFDNEVVRIQIK